MRTMVGRWDALVAHRRPWAAATLSVHALCVARRRTMARDCAAPCRGRARNSWWRRRLPAAAPAMLRRVSGDVVTAGLNSSDYVSIESYVQGEQRCLSQRYRWKTVRQGTAMITSSSGHMFTRNSAAYDSLHSTSTTMASIFIVNSYQINFESVLMIPDHDGMLNMFKALEANGLRGFLGCESVIYENELDQFFDTALVQGDDITGAVSGKFFSISQARFAQIFELPTEGLVNFSEVPKDRVYDARSIFSQKGVQVEIHGKKKYMKYEFRLLNDILAKAVNVKAGLFDAVTTERFQMMTAIHFGLKVNWSKVLFNVLKDMVDRSQNKAKGFAAQIGVLLKSMPAITMGYGVPFPNAKILSMKTVNTYIATNITIDARGENVEPGLAKVAVVKRTPKSKNKSSSTDETPVEVISEIAGSKKRQATEAVNSPVPKRKSRKRRYHYRTGIGGDFEVGRKNNVPEIVGPRTFTEAEGSTSPVVYMSIDDLLLQISNDMLLPSITATEITKIQRGESVSITEARERDWAETDSLEMSVKRKAYILAKYRELLLRKFLDSHRKYFAPGQPWTATTSLIIDLLSHSKSLEDLLAQQKDHSLPMDQPCASTMFDSSVGSGAVLARFYSVAKSTCWVRPMILVNGVWTPLQGPDFWKSSCRLSLFLNEKKIPDPVIEENFVPHVPFLEPVQYWEAAPCLIKTWQWTKVCTEIIQFTYFLKSFAEGVRIDSFVGYFGDSNVQSDLEIGSDFEDSYSDAPTLYRSPSPFFQEADSFALGPAAPSGVAQEEQLYYVESPESPPPLPQREESSSSSWDSQMHFDSTDIPLDATTEAQTSIPAAPVDFSPLLNDLQASLSQCVDAAHSDILSRLHSIEQSLQTSLGHQNDYLRSLIQGARQEGQIQDDLLILRLNELKKTVMAQGVTTATDSLSFKSRFNALDAKLLLLDGQVAAIRTSSI
ncbi:dystroglycan-like [Dorcoceras hygrometricum]|uniref:Dystroglycan-like n=1 Tax=Dorcoceras hygrometricum TaxID=472368 RepID=A0A2Z7CC88_9LAMI|nr:dystroglycan-like [Dorcoceras hygrometricum]